MNKHFKIGIRNFIGIATLLASITFAAIVSAEELANLLPEKYRNRAIIVGTTATMPPVESVDPVTGEIVGFEADLARAIGRELGVEIQIQNVAFDGLLAGMQAGRFDVAMAGLADTVQRQNGMDFVDWYASGIQFIVFKGNPHEITGLDTLCGLTLSGTRNSTEYRYMEAVAQKCNLNTPLIATENSPAGLLLLKTGRVDVFAANYPSGFHYARNNPDVELIPGQFKVINRGAAFAKNNSELRDAWRAGLQAIIDSGEYDQIMERWEAQDASYKGATINTATDNN